MKSMWIGCLGLALMLGALAAGAAIAQDKPEKKGIDFTQALKLPDGKPLMGGDQAHPEPLTLGDVTAIALWTGLPEDQQAPASKKIVRDALAERLAKCRSCEISAAEATLILERLNKVPGFGARVYSQAARLLDPVAWQKAVKESAE